MLEFRENPDRAVYLNRTIDKELYNSLVPQVLSLRASSADPICLYLDSFGGSVSFAEKLHEIIKAPRQNGDICRLITVVPSIAASAAADIAILSDYCIVYPSAVIWCHGNRVGSDEVTVDNIKQYEQYLKQSNQEHATKLAFAVCGRLIQRLSAYAQNQDSEELTNTILRNSEISDYLRKFDSQSSSTRKFIKLVLSSWDSKNELLKTLNRSASPKEFMQQLTENYIDILDDDADLANVMDNISGDIEQISEFYAGQEEDIDNIDVSYGTLMLTDEEFDSAKFHLSRDRVEKMWNFAVHFCHCLHSGEHKFNSIEAYHLGLVDEIVGLTDTYPSTRTLIETIANQQ